MRKHKNHGEARHGKVRPAPARQGRVAEGGVRYVVAFSVQDARAGLYRSGLLDGASLVWVSSWHVARVVPQQSNVHFASGWHRLKQCGEIKDELTKRRCTFLDLK